MAETFGHGTVLAYSADGVTYTDIDEVVSIDAVKGKRKKIKKTRLDSANEHEQFRAGLKETDELKVKVQYVKTIFATLLGFFNATSPQKYWKITLADGSSTAGTGYISEIDQAPKADSEDILYFDFSVQPDSKWTFTAAA